MFRPAALCVSRYGECVPESSLLPAEAPVRRIGLRAQIWRFTVSGALSAVIDLGITLLLVNTYVGSEALTRSVGFVCGTATAYMINRRWTFRSDPSKRRMALVWVLYGLTFGINVGLYTVVFGLLDTAMPSNLARFGAFAVGQGVATFLNFVIQRVVIFRLRFR